ncbi:MAG TPA: hypothetical protein VFW33_02550, partial [Gemmataceae bacterium]|nr:hypothetical protein [Gemmataceae bacterium]
RYAPPASAGGDTSPGAPYGLMDGFVLHHTKSPTLTQAQIIARAEANSRLYAQFIAGKNAAGGLGSVNLADADVTFGFLHSDLTTYDEPPAANTFPNTVHVKVKMDGSSNAALPLFFGKVFGVSTQSITADAYATIFNGPVVSLNGNGGMLPLAVDQNFWNAYIQYLNSGSPANSNVTTSVAPAGGGANLNITYQLAVTPDGNGFQQLPVFPAPDKLGTAGRGWLSLNDSSVDAADLKNWASKGLTSPDVTALTTSITAGSSHDVLLPLPTSGSGDGTSSHNTSAWDWQADPGTKASVPPYLPLNTPSLLPLFQPVDPDPSNNYQAGTKGPDTGFATADGDPAKGSNLYLNIVGFAAVTVTDNSGNVSVEPSASVPPGGIFGSVKPADSSASAFYGTFTIPRLTRPGG